MYAKPTPGVYQHALAYADVIRYSVTALEEWMFERMRLRFVEHIHAQVVSYNAMCLIVE